MTKQELEDLRDLLIVYNVFLEEMGCDLDAARIFKAQGVWRKA